MAFSKTKAFIHEVLQSYKERTQALSALATSLDAHTAAIITHRDVASEIAQSTRYLARSEALRLQREGRPSTF